MVLLDMVFSPNMGSVVLRSSQGRFCFFLYVYWLNNVIQKRTQPTYNAETKKNKIKRPAEDPERQEQKE